MHSLKARMSCNKQNHLPSIAVNVDQVETPRGNKMGALTLLGIPCIPLRPACIVQGGPYYRITGYSSGGRHDKPEMVASSLEPCKQ